MKQQLLRLRQQAKQSNLVLVAQNKQTGKIRPLKESEQYLTLEEVPLLLSKDDEAYLLSQIEPSERQQKHLNLIMSECRPLGISDDISQQISDRIKNKDIFSTQALSLIFNGDNDKIKQALTLFSQFPKHFNAEYVADPLDDQLLNQTLGLIETKTKSRSEQQLQQFDMSIDQIEPIYKNKQLSTLTIHIQFKLQLKQVPNHAQLCVYSFENPNDWFDLQATCLSDNWQVNDSGKLIFSDKITPKKKITLEINIPIATLSEKSSFRHKEAPNRLSLSFKSILSDSNQVVYSDTAHGDITLSTLKSPTIPYLNHAFSILNHLIIKEYFKLEGGYIGFLQTLEWIKDKAQIVIQSNCEFSTEQHPHFTQTSSKKSLSIQKESLLSLFLNWHSGFLTDNDAISLPSLIEETDFHFTANVQIDNDSHQFAPIQCYSQNNQTHAFNDIQDTLEKILKKDDEEYIKKERPLSEVFNINQYPFLLNLESPFPFDNSQNIIALSQVSSIIALSKDDSWHESSLYIHPIITTLLKEIVEDYWEMMCHIIQDQLSKKTFYAVCFDSNYLSDQQISDFSKLIHTQAKLSATLDITDKLDRLLEQFPDITEDKHQDYKSKIISILYRYRIYQKEHATVIDSILDHVTPHAHTIDQLIEIIKQNQDLRYKSYSPKNTFLDFRKKHIIQNITHLSKQTHANFPALKTNIQNFNLFDDDKFSKIKNFDPWHDSLNISALFNELGFTYNRDTRFNALIFRQNNQDCQLYIKHRDTLIPIVLFKDLSSYELVRAKTTCFTVDIPYILETSEEALIDSDFQSPGTDYDLVIEHCYHQSKEAPLQSNLQPDINTIINQYTWFFKSTFSTMVESVFQDHIIDLDKTFQVTNPITQPLSTHLILLIKKAEDLFYQRLQHDLKDNDNARQYFIDIKRYLDKYAFIEKFTLSLSEKLLVNLKYKIKNDSQWADYPKKGNAILISLNGIHWLRKSLSEVRLIDYQTTENKIHKQIEAFKQTLFPNLLKAACFDYEEAIHQGHSSCQFTDLDINQLNISVEKTIKNHILHLLEDVLSEQSDQSPLSHLIKERTVEKLVHVFKRFYDENWIFADYLKIRNTLQDPALSTKEKASRTLQFIKINDSVTNTFTQNVRDIFNTLLNDTQRFSYYENMKITPNHQDNKTWIARRSIFLHLTTMHLLINKMRDDFSTHILDNNQLEQNLIMLYQENFNPIVSSLGLENYIYFCDYEGINNKQIHQEFLQTSFHCAQRFFKDWFISATEALLPKNQLIFIAHYSGSFIDYEDNHPISFGQKESKIISEVDFYGKLHQTTQRFLEFIKVLEFNQVQSDEWIQNPVVIDIYDQLFKKNASDKQALLGLMQHGDIFQSHPILEIIGNALFWGDHIENEPMKNTHWIRWYLTLSNAPSDIVSLLTHYETQHLSYPEIEDHFLSKLSERLALNTALIKKAIAAARCFSHPFQQHFDAKISSFEIVRGKLLPAYFLSYLFSDRQEAHHEAFHNPAILTVTNPDLSPITHPGIPTYHYASLLNHLILLKSVATKLQLSSSNLEKALLIVPIDKEHCQIQLDNQYQRCAIMNIAGIDDIQAIRLLLDKITFEA